MTDTGTTDDRDTNVGFHPPAQNDAPASKSMMAIIIVLLVVGTAIAVMVYNHYNSDAKYPPPTEQAPPTPLKP
jgi:flagellar basal body-associated protein FliL